MTDTAKTLKILIHQRQLWELFQVLDMVNGRCPAVSAFTLTSLALIVIALQYLSAFSFPFLVLVELLYLANIDKLYNFFSCHISPKQKAALPDGSLIHCLSRNDSPTTPTLEIRH